MEQMSVKKSVKFTNAVMILFFIVCLICSALLCTYYRQIREIDLGQMQALRVALYAVAFCFFALGEKKKRYSPMYP